MEILAGIGIAAGVGVPTYVALREPDLERVIAEQGYVPYRSNSPVKDARLLVFGDLHGVMDDEFSAIVERAVRKKEDIVLVEAPFGFLEDFRDNKGAELKEPEEGSEKNFGRVLYEKNKGIVKGVDGKEEDIDNLVQVSVQMLTLNEIRKRIDNKKPLHDFHQWMIYQDLKIATTRDQDSYVRNGISDVLKKYEKITVDDLIDSRDPIIADNVIKEVNALNKENRALMHFGSAHITGPTILPAIEKAGIPYAAFVPHEGRVFGKGATVKDDHEKNAQDHFARLSKEYVKLRAKQGVQEYQGNYIGVIGK